MPIDQLEIHLDRLPVVDKSYVMSGTDWKLQIGLIVVVPLRMTSSWTHANKGFRITSRLDRSNGSFR
jgi:hypothetical protein